MFGDLVIIILLKRLACGTADKGVTRPFPALADKTLPACFSLKSPFSGAPGCGIAILRYSEVSGQFPKASAAILLPVAPIFSALSMPV